MPKIYEWEKIKKKMKSHLLHLGYTQTMDYSKRKSFHNSTLEKPSLYTHHGVSDTRGNVLVFTQLEAPRFETLKDLSKMDM